MSALILFFRVYIQVSLSFVLCGRLFLSLVFSNFFSFFKIRLYYTYPSSHPDEGMSPDFDRFFQLYQISSLQVLHAVSLERISDSAVIKFTFPSIYSWLNNLFALLKVPGKHPENWKFWIENHETAYQLNIQFWNYFHISSLKFFEQAYFRISGKTNKQSCNSFTCIFQRFYYDFTLH